MGLLVAVAVLLVVVLSCAVGHTVWKTAGGDGAGLVEPEMVG